MRSFPRILLQTHLQGLGKPEKSLKFWKAAATCLPSPRGCCWQGCLKGDPETSAETGSRPASPAVCVGRAPAAEALQEEAAPADRMPRPRPQELPHGGVSSRSGHLQGRVCIGHQLPVRGKRAGGQHRQEWMRAEEVEQAARGGEGVGLPVHTRLVHPSHPHPDFSVSVSPLFPSQ